MEQENKFDLIHFEIVDRLYDIADKAVKADVQLSEIDKMHYDFYIDVLNRTSPEDSIAYSCFEEDTILRTLGAGHGHNRFNQ